MATLIQATVSEKSSPSPQLEAVGRGLARYGLVVVVGWIGLMKFTTYEAEGIRPFVANSPLMSWVYGYMSVRGFSAVLGSPGFMPFGAGFLAGYLFYDMLHYHVHHHRPKTALGKTLRELHMRHHFQNHERGYGVSAPFWDHVFGTAPKTTIR